jgi:hypothetical protein
VKTAFFAGLLGLSLPAYAWDKHQSLMQIALPEMLKLVSPETKKLLEEAWPAPCPLEEFQRYQGLAQKLELNPLLSAQDPLPALALANVTDGTSAEEHCGKRFKLTGVQALLHTLVDEPDGGMDQNLDESFDRENERRWMGGLHGLNSQGFRHMIFAGWSWRHPLTTFQIPLQSIGQAPQRIELLSGTAQNFFKQGDLVWGIRLMGWAMHYMQDLTQPFHTVQVPRLAMLPWGELLGWNPKESFKRFVAESTRIISNYHHAYEHYVLHVGQQADQAWNACFTTPLKVETGLSSLTPQTLALELVDRTRDLNAEFGDAFLDFFGRDLKEPDFDLVKEKGEISYSTLATDPLLEAPRKRIHQLTCEAFRNFTLFSALLMDAAATTLQN